MVKMPLALFSSVKKMGRSISFRRLPEVNPIFIDYVEDFERLRSYFQEDYRQPVRSWESLKDFSNTVKEDLVEGLLGDAERWKYHRNAVENIKKLRNADTLAVITGQQAGLFGGPLYTYYKALSAVVWARRIHEQTGRPTIPVFWMETSDHDFFEINYIRLLDLDGEEVTLSLTNPPEEKRRVVGSITFNGEIEQLIHRLWNLLPANTYRGPLLEFLSTIYQPGANVGSGFAQLYNYLFGEDGLVIFDAENALCKKAVVPLLDRVLMLSDELNNRLQETTDAICGAGYPAQIQPQNDRLQLFFKSGNVRVPISRDGILLHAGSPPEEVGIEELRRRAASGPELFLPKVSIRPIMQDYLFPTAAFVAGPSEIAYFAQLKPLYEVLNVKMPVIIPRLSLTLIETKINKILEKFNFTPEQLRMSAQDLVREHLENDPSNDLVGLFAQARKKWAEIGEDLTLGLMRIDPTLQHPLEKTIMRWQQGLNNLEEKARNALARKNETAISQIHKCCSHLAPSGHLQERRFSLQYYLARYGRALGRHILSQVKIDKFRHQLVNMENDK